MRHLAVDWGTSRVRAYLVDGGAILAEAEAAEGVSRLRAGEHAAVFERLCGGWLADDQALPVVLVGMVGSREGWFPAPYAACPAGPAEIAAELAPVDLGPGRRGVVVPGLVSAPGDPVDVIRGEETHLLGSGVVDGLVCLPGTHCKWAAMEGGRIARFATFMTGEMHALLRGHSMIGRPATEPGDPDGFRVGLDAAGGAEGAGGLLNLLFQARARTVTGELPPSMLGPYLSGLLTGEEVAGALRLFGRPPLITVVADPPRSDLYAEALARHGIALALVPPRRSLVAGIDRILTAASFHLSTPS